MNLKAKLKDIGLLRIILLFLVVVLSVLYYFRGEIQEHKVTKAKLEMFRRMYKEPPKQWDEEFKQIYDSLIIEKVDSSEVK